MAAADPKAPVLVGVGEASRQSLGAEWPSPVDLASAAVKTALDDSGAAAKLAASVDYLLATRLFFDSMVPHDYGSPENFPEAVADAAGLKPAQLAYGDIGGQSPQYYVNRLAKKLYEGEIKTAIITGAEAVGTTKRARKASHEMNWSQPATREFEDKVTTDAPILTMYEVRHGIVSMPLAYGLLENARRARLGKSREEQARDMAELWAAFSQVSLTREHAQFARAWTTDELLDDDNGNYRLNDPYRRWMVAQDAVDVGGAAILTTAGHAADLGIAPEKMIHLHASADASVPLISLQDDLSHSPAMDWAFAEAVERAELQASDIGPVDIYSCFPVAVTHGIDALGQAGRPLSSYTLTGGLTFFGGPGNSYSIHAIVALVQALREDGSKPGLISANGGVINKESVGIYAAERAPDWSPDRIAPPLKIPPSDKAQADYFTSGNAVIKSYVTAYGKDGPGLATLWVEDEQGRNALALTDAPVADEDLIGRKVTITSDDKRNHAALNG